MPLGILSWVWLEQLSEELEGHSAETLDRAPSGLPQGHIYGGVTSELISFLLTRLK